MFAAYQTFILLVFSSSHLWPSWGSQPWAQGYWSFLTRSSRETKRIYDQVSQQETSRCPPVSCSVEQRLLLSLSHHYVTQTPWATKVLHVNVDSHIPMSTRQENRADHVICLRADLHGDSVPFHTIKCIDCSNSGVSVFFVDVDKALLCGDLDDLVGLDPHVQTVMWRSHMKILCCCVCLQSCWAPPRGWTWTTRTQMGEWWSKHYKTLFCSVSTARSAQTVSTCWSQTCWLLVCPFSWLSRFRVCVECQKIKSALCFLSFMLS